LHNWKNRLGQQFSAPTIILLQISFEQLQKDNRVRIVDYFVNINGKTRLEELRFY